MIVISLPTKRKDKKMARHFEEDNNTQYRVCYSSLNIPRGRETRSVIKRKYAVCNQEKIQSIEADWQTVQVLDEQKRTFSYSY